VLNDFRDCLILSSAINGCDILITEDTDIHNVKEDKNYQEIINAKNPKFKIYKIMSPYNVYLSFILFKLTMP